MVQWRKPEELSEHIIDRRPQGGARRGAASGRLPERIHHREMLEEIRRQQEANLRAAVLRRFGTRRGRG